MVDFSDLVPPPAPGTQVESGGLDFSDLVPKKPQTVAAPSMAGFEDLVPNAGPLTYAKEFGASALEGGKNLVAGALEGFGALARQADVEQLQRLEAGPQFPAPMLPLARQAEGSAVEGETLEARKQRLRERAAIPTTEQPLYRAGKAVEQFGSQALGPGPGFKGSVTRDLGGATGSMFGGIGLSLVPGVGPYLAGATFLGAGSGESAERAIQAKATEAQIGKAAELGTIAGATDLVDELIPYLGSTGKAAGFIAKVVRRVGWSGLTEGLQEGTQQFIQNMIAQKVYKPDQDLMEDVPYNALIGAVVGGAAGAVFGHGGHEAEPPVDTSDVGVRKSLAKLRGTPLPPGLQAPVESGVEPGVELPPEPVPAPAVVLPQAPTPTPVAPLAGEAPVGTQAPAPPNDLPTQMPPQVSSFIDSQVAKLNVPEPGVSPAVQRARDDFVKDPNYTDFNVVRQEFGIQGLADYMAEWGRLTKEWEESTAELKATTGLEPMRQEIRAQAGADLGRLARLLGPKLYGEPSNLATVTVKEMFQNAFDAIKDVLSRGGEAGRIDIRMDRQDRTIQLTDDGIGMLPETLGTKFLQIAGTEKLSGQSSGGLGIAKMLFLFGNQALSVRTMRNGKVASMTTTGEELFAALNDPSRNPRITISNPTAADKKVFPKGHGTAIIVKVPETYKDTATGEVKRIDFPNWQQAHNVLNYSPLFRKIDVTFNGRPVEGVGSSFPKEAFTQFANVNFDWGTARIYVSKTEVDPDYEGNLHVLSNGLWQFSDELKDAPGWEGKMVPRQFFVDVQPKVGAEDAGYPFDLNRQGFSPTTTKDFEQIFRYMSLLYQKEKFAADVKNWGDTYYLSVEPDGRVFASDRIKVEPKLPPSETALTRIQPGDSVKVEDGHLVVNGREIPELTPKDLKAAKIDIGELVIDQGDIDPSRVMVHDNVDVALSGATLDEAAPLDPFAQQPFQPDAYVTSDGGYEVRSMVDLGRERFGARFDRFMHDIGTAFIELRDIVADAMGGDYEAMRREAVGISFDIRYRGVSIRVPFAGFFVNPAATEYRDTLRASIGIVGTMVHELAHHKVRGHDADFPAEMQRIIIHLDTHPTFNFHAFKQRVVNSFTSHEDIAQFLYGVLDGNVGPVSPRGKQFSDASLQQTGDGSTPGRVAAARTGPGSGSAVSGGPARGEAAIGPESGSAAVLGSAPEERTSTTAPGPGNVPTAASSPATIVEWFVDQYLGVTSTEGRAAEPGGAVHFEEIAARSGLGPDQLQALVQKAVDVPGGPKDFSLARQTRQGSGHMRLRISGREYTGIKLRGSGSKLSPQFEEVGSQEPKPNVTVRTSRGSGGEADNGLARNQRALDATQEGDAGASPIQPETQAIRSTVSRLFKNNTPAPIRSAAAHADKMNWFYKWFAGLDQLAERNPFFAPLIRYMERVREMHLVESKLHDAALRLSKDWRSLGEEGDRVVGFLDELTNMTYRSPSEISQGISRHPSALELDRLVKQYKLSAKGLELVTKIKALTDGFLQLVGQNAIERAQRTILDPGRLRAKVAAIQREVQALSARPYFPFMRFGRHYVIVKDPAGKVIHFETVEGQGFSRLAGKNRSAERAQLRRETEMKQQFQRDYGRAPTEKEVYHGVLPESVGPLVGMPQLLLNEMKDAMFLTPAQLQNITLVQQATALGLQPVLNPRYQRRYFRPGQSVYTPGYSMDFKRSFARFFFHGAKFYSKTKFLDELRAHVRDAEQSPGNKEGYIASYMRDHLDNTVLDARGDFGIYKAAIFFWAMGYVPAAATQNLAQTPMVTFPFLAAKFGDVRATREMVAAMTKVSSFYKRGSYDGQTDFEMRALGYGIKTGRISETQAPELAGIAQGANLLKGIGGSVAERNWVWFMEKSAWMFEMAEQWNRRIAYRAALNLALKQPNAKVVDEAIQLNQSEFQRLQTEEGFSEAEARAVIAANHTVDQTQFTYARWARPRFMRGPKSILFVFKKYIQSLYFMLGNNKRDVLPRYTLIAAFIGGLGGLPFAEDLLSLLKAVWSWLGLGNLEHEARRWIMQFFDGRVDPDLVLHGLSRRGFGVPALLDLMGSFVTGRPGRGLAAPRHDAEGRPQGFAQNVPFPVLDRSRAISPGMISPFDIGKALTPSTDQDRTTVEAIQRASGAVFSVGFNIYKAAMDNSLPMSDWKRWERAVPRQLGDMSRAWRFLSEGRERNRGGPGAGSTVVPFDPRDTEQMMEIMAAAGGYQPLRLQARWDQIIAKAEIEQFYDLQRNGLLSQLAEARGGKRPEEIEKVIGAIREFNSGLPEWARGRAITSDTARKSLDARERARVYREAGVPSQRTNVPLSREIDRLFPESTVDVRRVR